MEIKRLTVNILKRDKDALRTLAQRRGESVAVVVRQIIRDALQERGVYQGAICKGGKPCSN